MIWLGHLELFVRDPLLSIAFYRDQLGFRVVEIQVEHFVWLESNGMELLLRPGSPPLSAPTYEQTAIAFVLYTDDLLDAVEQLRHRPRRSLSYLHGSRRPLVPTRRPQSSLSNCGYS